MSEGSFFSAPSPASTVYRIFMTVTLTGVSWYLTVILMYISLKISDTEHLCTCLLVLIFNCSLSNNFSSIIFSLFKNHHHCLTNFKSSLPSSQQIWIPVSVPISEDICLLLTQPMFLFLQVTQLIARPSPLLVGLSSRCWKVAEAEALLRPGP